NRVIKIINAAPGAPVNVWWNVGSSATYEMNSVVIGVTMAYATITVQTGAVTGALLAANGAVTLSSNTVTAHDASASAIGNCSTSAPAINPTAAPVADAVA